VDGVPWMRRARVVGSVHVCLSVYLFICLSVYLFICLSVCLYVCSFETESTNGRVKEQGLGGPTVDATAAAAATSSARFWGRMCDRGVVFAKAMWRVCGSCVRV